MITRLHPAIAIVFRRRLVPITTVNLRTHRRRVAPMLWRLFPRIS